MCLLFRLIVTLGLCCIMSTGNAQTAWVPPANERVDGPILTYMRSNAGWYATVSLPEPGTAIAWRLGEQGAWHDTGLLDTIDQRSGRRMPNPAFQLDSDTPVSTIYLRYATASGATPGPFTYHFDPMVELVKGQRQILEMTGGSWIEFRVFNGLLLYYTHLVSYRCAIKELRIGIDNPVPDKLIALPPCDLKNPNNIPNGAEVLLKVPVKTASASVQVVYADGSVSEVRQVRR